MYNLDGSDFALHYRKDAAPVGAVPQKKKKFLGIHIHIMIVPFVSGLFALR